MQWCHDMPARFAGGPLAYDDDHWHMGELIVKKIGCTVLTLKPATISAVDTSWRSSTSEVLGRAHRCRAYGGNFCDQDRLCITTVPLVAQMIVTTYWCVNHCLKCLMRLLSDTQGLAIEVFSCTMTTHQPTRQGELKSS